MGENWEGLRRLVEADYHTPRRESVLYIIDNVPAGIDHIANISRKKSLINLGPATWSYMLHNHTPRLRTGELIAIKSDASEDIVQDIDTTLSMVEPPVQE